MQTSHTTVDSVELITEWPVERSVICGRAKTNVKRSNDSGPCSEIMNKRKRHSCKFDSQVLVRTLPLSHCAKAILAMWWKGRKANNQTQSLNDESSLSYDVSNHARLNSDSKLITISRLPAAQEFIKQQIELLLEANFSDLSSEEAVMAHSNISWFYERLQKYDKAMEHIEKALLFLPKSQEMKWKKIKIAKQLLIHQTQQDYQLTSPLSHLPTGTATTIKQVARVDANHLSCADFFTLYSLSHTPLIITGLAGTITRVPWTLSYIRTVAGGCTFTPKVHAQDSVEWAKLEPTVPSTVSDFMDALTTDDNQERKQYLFDWSLPLHSPELAKDITIPKYFANDFLQRTRPGSLYHDSWPSLFIAPPDIVSELHVDSFASNFWMALLSGHKRWTFFMREDLAKLYPTYYESMDAVFDVDLSDADYNKHPLLRLATPYECVLQPGEVLFVPTGCPHRVENLDLSVAISGNYVDASNFDMVKEELHTNGLVNPFARDLYQQFSDPSFNTTMDLDIDHLPWSEYKQNQQTGIDVK